MERCSSLPVAAFATIALAMMALIWCDSGIEAFSAPVPITSCPRRYRPSSATLSQSSIDICTRSNHQSTTRGLLLHILYSAEGGDIIGDQSNTNNDDSTAEEVEVTPDDSLTPSQIQSLKSQRNSFVTTIKEFFTNKTKFNRESLGKLGVSALLAYGFVSNVSGVLAVSSAWFIFSKRVSFYLCDILFVCLPCRDFVLIQHFVS